MVLLAGIAVVLVVAAAIAGVLARRHRITGLLVVVLLGAVAAAAVLSRPGARPLDVLPTVLGAAAGLLALDALASRVRDTVARETGLDRRTFVRFAAGTGVAYLTIQQIYQASGCANCHKSGNAQGGFDLTSARKYVNVASSNVGRAAFRVRPSSPSESGVAVMVAACVGVITPPL